MVVKCPINKNYCATVVQIDKIVELANCDNVKHAIIFGNSVIVSKDVQKDDVGLFFPIETKLSDEFLSANNLYKDSTLNANVDEKGYFETNARIKCMKFRGNKSEGFFIPIESLLSFATEKELVSLRIGDEFDELNGNKICEKYVIKTKGAIGRGSGTAQTRISRIVPEQFRLHVDTNNLRKSVANLSPDDVISLTYKLHGTSFVVGDVLTHSKLTRVERFLQWLKFPIKNQEYDYVYSSRRVIKNEYETKTNNHYYGSDIWALVKEELKESLQKGISVYGEIVGFLPSGEAIQAGYDYGCAPNNHATYVYRITSTNADGKVIEFTWGQVKEYCNKYGLNHVPELYYGRAKHLFPISTENHWHQTFLVMLEDLYLEKDCYMSKAKVPGEGIVVKADKLFDCEPYKLKSFRFLERETKELDKGIVDIESEQSET